MSAKQGKQKVALIGASLRVGALVQALLKDYQDKYELCAVLDTDATKMRNFNIFHGINLPTYSAVDFEQMCKQCSPDIAVITTVDGTHADYVANCLDNKISCLVEKPLCINAAQCRAILAAQQRNRDVYAKTMHNSRYHITFRKVKDLVDSGAIGKIRSIFYDEKLDLFHGSSYFRRWNRCKAQSGGLQIHKSSHHFDKINWLLASKPESVVAMGRQVAYGPNASTFHGVKCSACQHREVCPFFLDARQNRIYNEMFYKNHADQEKDFYTPDACVFASEIDIEDFLSVICNYENGVPLNYTLNAHSNYEGETLHVEGEKGRLEMTRHTFRAIENRGRDKLLGRHNSLRLIRFGKMEIETFNVDDEGDENHGGCDRRIYADLFGNANSGALASLEDGIQAVLVGIAANISMDTGRRVKVQELLGMNKNA